MKVSAQVFDGEFELRGEMWRYENINIQDKTPINWYLNFYNKNSFLKTNGFDYL